MVSSTRYWPMETRITQTPDFCVSDRGIGRNPNNLSVEDDPASTKATHTSKVLCISKLSGVANRYCISGCDLWSDLESLAVTTEHQVGSMDRQGDEPFLINMRDKPFAVVPYTLHMNDIVDYETRYLSTAMYPDDLKAEFDALYAEAGMRRRMMSVSAHDRIAARPSRARMLEEFIIYAQSHSGVTFMRKYEIARFALEGPFTVRKGI
jgi:peptidoglycan/xylan/chitin deacetylase (PgdA/CDA1 family)